MITYTQALTSFSLLTYDQKKEKVLAMLKILKEEGNIFQDLWDLMHINDNVSESIIEMIYKVITKAMYSIKEKEMEQAVDKLEKVKGKMANINNMAEKEQVDADEVLSKLL